MYPSVTGYFKLVGFDGKEQKKTRSFASRYYMTEIRMSFIVNSFSLLMKSVYIIARKNSKKTV